MKTIGNRIKERRNVLDLSVPDLAEKLGKNKATVYRYESDYIENLPIKILAPLAIALQTTPAYLIGWDDNNENMNSEIKNLVTMNDDEMIELLMTIFRELPREKQIEAIRYFRYLAIS